MDFGHYWGQIKDNYSNIAVEPVVSCQPGQPYFTRAVLSVRSVAHEGPVERLLWAYLCLIHSIIFPLGIAFSFFFVFSSCVFTLLFSSIESRHFPVVMW